LDAPQTALFIASIVQRVGSAAIIQWGQEYTFEDAYSAVSAYLENLGRPNKEKA